MNMPLDKYDMYLASVLRTETKNRRIMVMDTAGAVGGLFTKGAVSEYLDSIGKDDGR